MNSVQAGELKPGLAGKDSPQAGPVSGLPAALGEASGQTDLSPNPPGALGKFLHLPAFVF